METIIEDKAERTHRVQTLRRELYGLGRAERELRREIGKRVISGQSAEDLRALRRDNRESQAWGEPLTLMGNGESM